MSSPSTTAPATTPENPTTDDAAPAPQIPDNRPADQSESGPVVPTTDDSSNTRRCFVCLVDEPQDTLPSDWSTPCTCSLEGHSDCLLTWVADLEAQSKDVKCPVCKSPITVTERWDAAIQLNNFLNRRFTRWSPRILLGFIASGALVSSSVYGAKAIDWFAGPEATIAFLFKKEERFTLLQALPRPTLHRSDDFPSPINLLNFSILPLVAPALVLNRLHLGEVVLIPASLLYAMLFDHPSDFLIWPPPPERVLALYPSVKATYFHLHRKVARHLEKKWASRVLDGETEQQAAARQQFPPPQHDNDDILDFEIDIQIGGGGGGEGAAADDAGQAQQDRALDVGSNSPINFIAGALLWPSVCYGAGELMRAVLPARFVTKPPSGPTTGLLQERWGRSLVGGCLFVVLKDAFFLYVKYRKVMNRPYRKIKNSERRHVRG